MIIIDTIKNLKIQIKINKLEKMVSEETNKYKKVYLTLALDRLKELAEDDTK